MKQYPWAANVNKLKRAIGAVGAEAPEELVKDFYLRIGGLLHSEYMPEVPVVVTPEEINPMVDESPEVGFPPLDGTGEVPVNEEVKPEVKPKVKKEKKSKEHAK